MRRRRRRHGSSSMSLLRRSSATPWRETLPGSHSEFLVSRVGCFQIGRFQRRGVSRLFEDKGTDIELAFEHFVILPRAPASYRRKANRLRGACIRLATRAGGAAQPRRGQAGTARPRLSATRRRREQPSCTTEHAAQIAWTAGDSDHPLSWLPICGCARIEWRRRPNHQENRPGREVDDGAALKAARFSPCAVLGRPAAAIP